MAEILGVAPTFIYPGFDCDSDAEFALQPLFEEKGPLIVRRCLHSLGDKVNCGAWCREGQLGRLGKLGNNLTLRRFTAGFRPQGWRSADTSILLWGAHSDS